MPNRDEYAREPSLRKLFLGSHVRAEREEKVPVHNPPRERERAPARRSAGGLRTPQLHSGRDRRDRQRPRARPRLQGKPLADVQVRELDPLQPRHASPRGPSAGREDGGDTPAGRVMTPR